jgi:AraC-like DNA-binding protein
MKYIKYKPDISLTQLIDFYWVLETDATYKPVKAPLYADVCTDIFFNTGTSAASFNGRDLLSPGNIYIGGTSTSHSFVNNFPGSIFIGIRFKPGGLATFYNIPLTDIVDRILEFRDVELTSILYPDETLAVRLDRYFIARQKKYAFFPVITELVHRHKGQVQVDSLSYHCNVSNRTLERIFQTNAGISPKTFIGIVRFQQALNVLQRSRSRGKLIDLAVESGYYDHAHFSREFKKFAGVNPSDIYPGPRFP